MKIGDIIGVNSPTDKSTESDRPFDTALVQGLLELIEGIKRSCDDVRVRAGERPLNPCGHNHGYGPEESLVEYASGAVFAAENCLLGRHIAKRAITCNQIEDYNGLVGPLAVIPHRLLNSKEGAFVLGERFMPLMFMTGPGTIEIDIELGVKSSGGGFEAQFSPDILKSPYFRDFQEESGWAQIGAASADRLTWITAFTGVIPRRVSELKLGVCGRGFSGEPDLNVWAIRVVEVPNLGALSFGDYKGFLADIHRADLREV